MSQLEQLIYCSVAKHQFSKDELTSMLTQARVKNAKIGVTGILLYSEGSFFQVLEGQSEIIDSLFARIAEDERHSRITVIIREPIARRSFANWTMGYADISGQEADSILETSDFFSGGQSFDQLGAGRAKKLLEAFKHGSWREKLSNTATPNHPTSYTSSPQRNPCAKTREKAIARRKDSLFSFAYQPIINAKTATIFSYEALLRGAHNESARDILQQVPPDDIYRFDEESRIFAIELAAQLGLSAHLNLNFLPGSAQTSATAITSILKTAERWQINPEQIVLEILEREIIEDVEQFNARINQYRGTGLSFAIDDFGSGYAGLNLLAEFQPTFIKLDMNLVRNIERKGPRQAIVRGILRTCTDLGIEIIAEGVETVEEFGWLRNEGIDLFQGYLFCKPTFECLPDGFQLPLPVINKMDLSSRTEEDTSTSSK